MHEHAHTRTNHITMRNRRGGLFLVFAQVGVGLFVSILSQADAHLCIAAFTAMQVAHA